VERVIVWNFQTKQETFEIGKVKVGGFPGERPVVLIGSLFYHGQKILKDEAKGEFDREVVEELISRQDEYSEKTGNPCMIDLVGATPEAMVKQLDFVTEATETSILVDSPSVDAKLAGSRRAAEAGFTSRIVYNSIMPGMKTKEIDGIRESGIESAILLAYRLDDFTSNGRLKTARNLVSTAKGAGIRKPLIDTCVLDVPTLGISSRALFKIKDEMGLPTGAGTHNAIETWTGLKKKMGEQAAVPSSVSAATAVVAAGADFVLYGPIEHAEYFFPALSMIDAAYGQMLFEEGKRPDKTHPLFRIA
jgi:tetrahydromethanopterin S-methyltransferase subunit H